VNALKVCPQCGTEYPANARFCEIDGTALRGAAVGSDLVGSIIADRYHVMKKLGEGGMGQVYLVEHVKMGRKSALKVMHPGMVKDVDAISRFNREAANASRIAHANVAAVYDFGETADGIIYLAMEFVDGPPLTKLIEETGGLPPKRAAEITRQTAEALAVAHDMGIVHRDLKPDNIMIGKTRDGDDIVKVVDFGIAKAAGNAAQKVTKTGLVVGTPDYMSPEQLAGDALDGRSDIYALGLVTFNMLTGTLPFPSDSAQESMIMRLTDKPKTLAEMRPEVAWPAEVQTVLDKALERDASLRYQNATDFGRDLSRAIQHLDTPAASIAAPTAGPPASSTSAPSTRVAPPGMPTPRSSPTVGVPAPSRPSDSSSGMPTLPATPPKRKILVPVVGSIAVLLVVSAALYKPILNMNKKVATADTTHSVTSNPPPQTKPDSAAPKDSVTRRPEEFSKGPASNSVDIGKELTNAEAEAKRDDTTSARSAIGRIGKIESRLESAGDVVRSGLVKYDAYLTLGDATKACAALNHVKDRAPGTSYQSKVDARLGAC
jgi:serine/threonine protein kinase